MAYKKPQIVAKSAAKQSFVAGCPCRANMTYELRQQCQQDRAR